MIEVVSNCIHDFFLIMRNFLIAFFTGNTNLAQFLRPAFGIGIAIAVVLLSIKLIKSITWGS